MGQVGQEGHTLGVRDPSFESCCHHVLIYNFGQVTSSPPHPGALVSAPGKKKKKAEMCDASRDPLRS